MFKDRAEAGQALAHRLREYKNAEGVVLAVPKGGVPIAYIVAKELGLPMELILSKKLGHPFNKEYAIGAVSLWGSFVIPHEDVSDQYIKKETERITAYLKEMKQRYACGEEAESLQNKTVIVIDDGIATGNTLLATINIISKQHPAKIIIAVPVTSRNAYDKLVRHVDKVVALVIPKYFIGVGGYYENFEDVTEEQVKACLEDLKAGRNRKMKI